MNREVIDLFQDFNYLTSDFIQKALKEGHPFPPNDYSASSFEDLSINIFDIPYITLL